MNETKSEGKEEEYQRYSAVRLRESGCWAAKSYGHSNILDEIPREIWASPTDYVTRKLNFTRNFAVDLPTSGVLQDYDTVFFTDGSKVAYGVGAGVSPVYSRRKYWRYWKSVDGWSVIRAPSVT